MERKGLLQAAVFIMRIAAVCTAPLCIIWAWRYLPVGYLERMAVGDAPIASIVIAGMCGTLLACLLMYLSRPWAFKVVLSPSLAIAIDCLYFVVEPTWRKPTLHAFKAVRT